MDRRAWSCRPRPGARTGRGLRGDKAPQQTRGAPGAPTAGHRAPDRKLLRRQNDRTRPRTAHAAGGTWQRSSNTDKLLPQKTPPQ